MCNCHKTILEKYNEHKKPELEKPYISFDFTTILNAEKNNSRRF